MRQETYQLEITGLSVGLPALADRALAVDGVTLGLYPNEIVCVVGESGSGKSVLARSVMGLMAPGLGTPRGSIRLSGQEILGAAPSRMRKLRGAEVGMIFQEPMTALNPLMTCGEQIAEMLREHRRDLDRASRKAQVLAMIEQVHLPDPGAIHDAYPHEISGGQRQRVMIAMALALDPKVLIADEPTTALDVTSQAQVLALIRELQRKRQTSVLFITHDFGVVAQIADRVAVMQHGRLVELGTARQVLTAPQHPYTRSLIDAVPRLVFRDKAPPVTAAPVLSVEGLTKTYGAKRPGLLRMASRRVEAVAGASLSIQPGRTVGIVGESGSGKSTLARCIARLTDIDDGRICLDGVDIASLRRAALRPVRRQVQMVFQDPFSSLNPRERVLDIIAKGPRIHGTPRRQAEAEARELLAMVGLRPTSADRFPHEFSGGQRQRIGIARALALKPSLLIADEPVSALDVSVQAQILKLLEQVRERFGLAMLFITHDLRVAAQVCDDVAVMRRGHIVEQGPTQDVFGRPSDPYTRQLLAAVPGRDWTLQSDDGPTAHDAQPEPLCDRQPALSA